MRVLIEQLQKGTSLTTDQMTKAMTEIMEQTATSDEIYRFLIALHNKGETIDEITAAAKVMRDKAITIKAPHGALDCCGTGGDAKGTYNISTAVALAAAACGVPIAKHGNRASTSKSGAADVLEVMGVNLDIDPKIAEYALKTIGFCFLMAPNHHPAMGHVKKIRKTIPHRTLFNLLGPLANPAKTKYQLIGVYDPALIPIFAEVLKNLGTKRAMIVHGTDRLDEITTTDKTLIARLDEHGTITEDTLTAESFGLNSGEMDNLIGGTAEQNAKALRAILEGRKDDYRDIVIANTAAVLTLHNPDLSLTEAAKKAAATLDDGSAYQILKDYIALSRQPPEDITL